MSLSVPSGARSDGRLNRRGLAQQAGVPDFVVDLVLDAGLLAPGRGDLGGPDDAARRSAQPRDLVGPDDLDERFGPEDVDMLVAVRTLLDEGTEVEELAALAMRHATHIEDLIDDSIDLLKRHIDRSGHGEDLAATMQRLVPAATRLVVGHFERTLWERAMARIEGSSGSTAGRVLVKARRLAERVDPLAVYASVAPDTDRCVWLRPDSDIGLAGIGVVESIEPTGDDRFSAASAARAVLAARIRWLGPDDAPAPVLMGGFSFFPGDLATGRSEDAPARAPCAGAGFSGQELSWEGFSDCKLVLPELTVIDGPEGAWVLAATRVGAGGDDAAAEAELDERLASFSVTSLTTGREAAARGVGQSGREAGDRGRGAGSRGGVDWANPLRRDDTDDEYLSAVADAVAAIDGGDLTKVVLARTVAISGELDAVEALDLLRLRNPACAVFAFSRGDSTFLGATPEELVTLDGPVLATAALAGTSPRGDDPEEDGRLADDMMASAKQRQEHRIVVEGITEALAGLGLVDPAPAEPVLMRLNRLQHLRTPITARVQRRRTGARDMDVLRAAGVLHPTPATGGAPTEAALEFIKAHEDFDRGWYAAPVGWCDLEGNGEIGVALRSALVQDGLSHLFAGAGIVADSHPADELAETAIKLQTLIDVISESCL